MTLFYRLGTILAIACSAGFMQRLEESHRELGTLFTTLSGMVTIGQALRSEPLVTEQQQQQARAKDFQMLAGMMKEHQAEARNDLQVGGSALNTLLRYA